MKMIESIKGLFKKDSKGVSMDSRTYFSSSEYVSAGHPDRVADIIASIVIDDIQKADGIKSHAAVEVFLTHDTVYFGGEVVTSLDLTKDYLTYVVRKGFQLAGYLPEMRCFWSKGEVMLADDMKVVNKICKQSPDIALGTTDKGEESGWNDQGVYFSSCDNTNDLGLGYTHYVAKLISDMLWSYSQESILGVYPLILGPDNKCVVTVKVGADGMTPECISDITIAVAHTSYVDEDCVRNFVRGEVIRLLRSHNIKVASNCNFVINGTGRFVIHGCISDTSMTGRKISVNHPSAGPVWCNKMIGGGSLVKPLHASDLMLNLASRYIANVIVNAGLSSYAVVGCAGAIGQKGLQSLFIKGDENFDKLDYDKIIAFFSNFVEWSPNGLARRLGFFEEDFSFIDVVRHNFFGDSDSQPWEKHSRFKYDVEALRAYLDFKS